MADRPDEAEPQPWHDLYWRAWDALKADRQFGAMGGASAVPYSALSRYARDHGITGSDFRLFQVLFRAIDAEWLTMEAAKGNKT
ncbi:phage tail assembly chaperone [Aminobacter aminovorans]|uniref:phage tail assembly chaperone n=1 Tax=Aminobacter aminovorans TaxID=83263 RepID=UPI00406BB6AF